MRGIGIRIRVWKYIARGASTPPHVRTTAKDLLVINAAGLMDFVRWRLAGPHYSTDDDSPSTMRAAMATVIRTADGQGHNYGRALA